MHEIYNPVSQDDPELITKGGKYQRKFSILQVTVRVPEHNFLNWIAVTYGFMAFVIGLSFPVMYLITQRFCYLYGIFIMVFCMILSEGFLKRLLKDPRPIESANRFPNGEMKYGMPSGHCMVSVSIMVWLLLELMFHPDGSQSLSDLETSWIIGVLVTSFPVPWSRWHNLDHTLAQCVVGSLLGSVIGLGAFWLRQKYYSHIYWPWEEEHISVGEIAANGNHGKGHVVEKVI